MATQVQKQMAGGSSDLGRKTPAQLSAASSCRDDWPEPIASQPLSPEYKGYAFTAKLSCVEMLQPFRTVLPEDVEHVLLASCIGSCLAGAAQTRNSICPPRCSALPKHPPT